MKKIIKIFLIIIVAGIALLAVFNIYTFFIEDRLAVYKFSGYYRDLAKQCLKRFESGCCMVSVRRMADNKLEVAPDSGCPEGYTSNTLKCLGSYKWCEPEGWSSREASINAEKIDFDHWQTYRNNVYGFEIKYSSDKWGQSNHAIGLLTLQLNDNDRQAFLNMNIKKGKVNSSIRTEEIIIDGRPAYKYFYQEGAGTSGVYLIPLMQDHLVLTLDYFKKSGNYEEIKTIEEIVNPILFSFKFLK